MEGITFERETIKQIAQAEGTLLIEKFRHKEHIIGGRISSEKLCHARSQVLRIAA